MIISNGKTFDLGRNPDVHKSHLFGLGHIPEISFSRHLDSTYSVDGPIRNQFQAERSTLLSPNCVSLIVFMPIEEASYALGSGVISNLIDSHDHATGMNSICNQISKSIHHGEVRNYAILLNSLAGKMDLPSKLKKDSTLGLLSKKLALPPQASCPTGDYEE